MGMPRTRMRVASMSLSWGNPQEDAFGPWLRQVKALGYEGISGFAWWGLERFLAEPAKLCRMLADEGLALASVDVETVGDLSRYEPVFDLMNEADCRAMVCLSAKRERATLEEEIDWLNRIGSAATARSIDACHHPRSMGVSATFAQADAVMRGTDPATVHLTVETGHSTKDFTDLPLEQRTVRLIEAHGARVRLVELKDWNEQTDLNTPLGEGEARLEAIRDALAAAGYAGWLVVEQNGNEGPSLGRDHAETARLSREKVRSVFGV